MFEVVVLAVIMTLMMIVIVIGNMLVVIAIATENNLTTVQNWFIASLAVADMLIGLVIMPFSLSYELMGYWMFGAIFCEVHAAMDVLLCTASIMNICLISLDRYWSITRAIDYLNARTPTRVAIMIVTVWLLSGLISIPPLLGWKKKQDLSWFDAVLDERGNRTQVEFLQYLDASGRMKLDNFTATLESVVFPQCGVSPGRSAQQWRDARNISKQLASSVAEYCLSLSPPLLHFSKWRLLISAACGCDVLIALSFCRKAALNAACSFPFPFLAHVQSLSGASVQYSLCREVRH
jgi:hypothetical protein